MTPSLLNRKAAKPAWVILVLLAWTRYLPAPGVGPALSLAKIVEQADVIVKATVISSQPASDAWFENRGGYQVSATRLEIISVIKGEVTTSQVEFHHYSRGGESRLVEVGPGPQIYEFQPGRPYLVFAVRTAQENACHQLWKDARIKSDQGVYLAADGLPVKSTEAKEVLFGEFTKMLESPAAEDVRYAMRQLDEMSNPDGRIIKLNDFDRSDVLRVISRLFSKPDPQIVQAAIQVVGSSSPYLKDESAEFWLAKVSGGRLEGLLPWQSDHNQGAHECYQSLITIADGDGPVSLRASAIRALGRTGLPEVGDAARRWVRSPEAQIRESATLLLADFPGPGANELLQSLVNDPAGPVRKAVARVVGFGQLTGLLPLLNQALQDANSEVRLAAAQSLVSFPASQSRDVLRANLADAEYRSVFVNALAEEDPRSCLDALCDVISNRLRPMRWNGKIPYAASWEILFGFLKTQSRGALESGQFGKELGVLEKVQVLSSSQPRDLYELYIKNGMTEQAAKFREYVSRTSRMNLEYFFNQVDQKYRIGK